MNVAQKNAETATSLRNRDRLANGEHGNRVLATADKRLTAPS